MDGWCRGVCAPTLCALSYAQRVEVGFWIGWLGLEQCFYPAHIPLVADVATEGSGFVQLIYLWLLLLQQRPYIVQAVFLPCSAVYGGMNWSCWKTGHPSGLKCLVFCQHMPARVSFQHTPAHSCWHSVHRNGRHESHASGCFLHRSAHLACLRGASSQLLCRWQCWPVSGRFASQLSLPESAQ